MLGMGNESIVFCTSYIDSDPQRYQDWIDYYTDYFRGFPVSLWMFNDGPCNVRLDLKGVHLHEFPERLGRQSVWIFPGWKRSFYAAMKAFQNVGWLGHIESDCWLTSRIKNDFIAYLYRDGYYTGWTRSYNFPEGALTVLNEPWVRSYFIDKYSCQENWYEDIDFEKDTLAPLKPTIFFNGDRVEKRFERFDRNYSYVSSTTYADFLTLYA